MKPSESTRGRKRRAVRPGKAKLAAMIEEATLDAYGWAEQAGGLFVMLEENLEIPFETTLLGVSVTVTGLDQRDAGEIVAICARGRERQAVLLVDLLLPSPAPAGVEWIEAYRCWRDGRY